MKKMKHRIVEHMSSSTADALGLSRAILCNGELSLGVQHAHFEHLEFTKLLLFC